MAPCQGIQLTEAKSPQETNIFYPNKDLYLAYDLLNDVLEYSVLWAWGSDHYVPADCIQFQFGDSLFGLHGKKLKWDCNSNF